jgi:hypothetical protein
MVGHWRDKVLVNAGSVGIPLDDNPSACYALLTRRTKGWMVEHPRVPYDLDALQRGFVEHGLLRTAHPLSELILREIVSAQIYVSPYLSRLFPLMHERGLDFARASAVFTPEATQPDLSYATPFWPGDNSG